MASPKRVVVPALEQENDAANLSDEISGKGEAVDDLIDAISDKIAPVLRQHLDAWFKDGMESSILTIEQGRDGDMELVISPFNAEGGDVAFSMDDVTTAIAQAEGSPDALRKLAGWLEEAAATLRQAADERNG